MDIGTAQVAAGILGGCPAMQRVRGQIAQFGPSELSVHVCGETGTGKEGVARALHAASPRAGGPFIPFNAAGSTDGLVEEDLFGHTKGAFTGACAAREGRVAAAEGGTLFIDEVAELTLRTQAMLLRFLEERCYQRLGENNVRRANVRVLSATNADLRGHVRDGRFRHDLWWRLQDTRLELPPLRERGDDVLLLARHFLRLEATKERRPAPALTPEVERVLVRHPWPGNVRQLRSEMRRLVVVAGGGRVGLEHLSPELLEKAERERPARLKARLDAVEREHLREALRRNHGARSRTAAELGISRQSLWLKLRRLKVEPGVNP